MRFRLDTLPPHIVLSYLLPFLVDDHAALWILLFGNRASRRRALRSRSTGARIHALYAPYLEHTPWVDRSTLMASKATAEELWSMSPPAGTWPGRPKSIYLPDFAKKRQWGVRTVQRWVPQVTTAYDHAHRCTWVSPRRCVVFTGTGLDLYDDNMNKLDELYLEYNRCYNRIWAIGGGRVMVYFLCRKLQIGGVDKSPNYGFDSGRCVGIVSTSGDNLRLCAFIGVGVTINRVCWLPAFNAVGLLVHAQPHCARFHIFDASLHCASIRRVDGRGADFEKLCEPSDDDRLVVGMNGRVVCVYFPRDKVINVYRLERVGADYNLGHLNTIRCGYGHALDGSSMRWLSSAHGGCIVLNHRLLRSAAVSSTVQLVKNVCGDKVVFGKEHVLPSVRSLNTFCGSWVSVTYSMQILLFELKAVQRTLVGGPIFDLVPVVGVDIRRETMSVYENGARGSPVRVEVSTRAHLYDCRLIGITPIGGYLMFSDYDKLRIFR